MRIDGHRLMVITASATAAALVEQVLVATALRLRYGPGASASAVESSSRTYRWGHLLLTEALATLQAEIVSQQLRASVAVARAIAEKQQAGVSVPLQHSRMGRSAPRPVVPASRPAAESSPSTLIPRTAP
ncbi:MAG: hypothetical protein QOJ32_1726 [Frankiaceae bacterium]|jgi:BarA-like signal transduction histidine kinase|nr:hypothetical protein [Frankiaceae bacterium]MDQ1649539.1 hypothetical protein [Frankiaceae bacterium]